MEHPKADAVARHAFRVKLKEYECAGRPIVYIDESGFAHDMPRTHGYVLRGQCCVGLHDWHAKGRVDVIVALPAGVLISTSITGVNVDADVFNLWLETYLLPVLPAASVLVMDRATFHRRADTKTIRRKTGQTHDEIFATKFRRNLKSSGYIFIERLWRSVNTPPTKVGGFGLRLKAGSVRHRAD